VSLPFSLFADFQSRFLGFLWRSFGGISLRDLVRESHMRTTLSLVTLPLQTRGKLSDLVVIVGARGLEVWSRDLGFPMIESV
jgi:hypothetical protein